MHMMMPGVAGLVWSLAAAEGALERLDVVDER